jgi:hypothetical protein
MEPTPSEPEGHVCLGSAEGVPSSGDVSQAPLTVSLAGLLYLAARKYVAESAQRQTVRRSPPETHETCMPLAGRAAKGEAKIDEGAEPRPPFTVILFFIRTTPSIYRYFHLPLFYHPQALARIFNRYSEICKTH